MTLSQSLMMCPGLLMKLEMNNPEAVINIERRAI